MPHCLKHLLMPVALCAGLLVAGAAMAADNKLAVSQPCQQGKLAGKHDGDAAAHSCWMSPDCSVCGDQPPV